MLLPPIGMSNESKLILWKRASVYWESPSQKFVLQEAVIIRVATFLESYYVTRQVRTTSNKSTKYKRERFKEGSIDWKESWWGYWWIVRVKNIVSVRNVGHEITENQTKNEATFLFSVNFLFGRSVKFNTKLPKG